MAGSVDFDHTPKSEKIIEQVSSNIARLKDILKERYGLDLIYLIIPNKFTLYSSIVDPRYKYDSFAPKLTRSLMARGVRSIDLYDLFSDLKTKTNQWLYFPTDTHWAPPALEATVRATARLVRETEKNEFGPCSSKITLHAKNDF